MSKEVGSKHPQILDAKAPTDTHTKFQKSQIYFFSHVKFKLSFNFIIDTLSAFLSMVRTACIA